MAELALAILGTIDLTLKYGKILVDTCSSFRHADQEMEERTLRIKNCWKRTSSQLDFLQRVANELDHELLVLQDETLTILASKLTATDMKIKSFLREQSSIQEMHTKTASAEKPKVRRFRYASLKEYLDKAIAEMESWQRQFDPSWYLIMRVANQQIDRELVQTRKDSQQVRIAFGIRDTLRDSLQSTVPSGIFLDEARLGSAKITPIPHSSAELVLLAGRNHPFILDYISADYHLDRKRRKKVVRDLAEKLTKIDPSTFSLLECAGAVETKASGDFRLVFKIPNDMSEPQTLRTRLLAGDFSHSLGAKFRLATQLAKAVCSVHTCGFVHKSIRPENIVMLHDESSSFGSAFLLGFERVRPEDFHTMLKGDDNWEMNIYRHPQRQGARLQDAYIMQHDIYSLGVCLLEIGLWSSFVQYDEHDKPVRPSEYKFGEENSDIADKAEFAKDEMLAIARACLPVQMGDNYTNIVETCLTCLDEGNDDFGEESEFQDADGILVAVRYIEKVFNQLSRIQV